MKNLKQKREDVPKKPMTKKYAYVRAVKNRLCRIQDNLTTAFVDKDVPEKSRRIVMMARIDIDSCVESLEKALKLIKQ